MRPADANQSRSTAKSTGLVGGTSSVAQEDVTWIEADFAVIEMQDLHQSGIRDPRKGLPDPQRPLGLTEQFDRAVEPENAKTSDAMLRSLMVARHYVETKGDGIPDELASVAVDVLDDEIRRHRLIADKVFGLLEV